MARTRPANIPPTAWLFAHDNSVIPGRSEKLAAAGAYSTPVAGQYGPGTVTTLVKVDAGDSGDSMVIGVTAQYGTTSSVVDASRSDVLLKAEWGNAGAPSFAYFKLGNGLTFSVPANFFRLMAQNLAAQCQVIGTAAPYPLPRSDISQPRYSFSIPGDAAYALRTLNVFRVYDVYADPTQFGAIPAAMRNPTRNATIPAPYIIPPYAQEFSFYIATGQAGVDYTVGQIDVNGLLLRQDTVHTSAAGQGVLADIELAAGCAQLLVTAPANITTGLYTFDFKIGL